jgi:hypothetical protein
MAKSENRFVESIRRGCYVCAEPLPAYEGFPIKTGDICKHLDWVRQNPVEAFLKLIAAQEFIRERYSPATIAKQWLEVINEHI